MAQRETRLIRLNKTLVLDAFVLHHVLLSARSVVCRDHVTRNGRLRKVILTGLDGVFYSKSSSSSSSSSISSSSRSSPSSVPTVPKTRKCTTGIVKINERKKISLFQGHLEALSSVADSFKEEKRDHSYHSQELGKANERIEQYEATAAKLQAELESLKAEEPDSIFTIHSLKDCDERLLRLVGVPTYSQFKELVDEVALPSQQGWGKLDKYNQAAAALIHLRTGATWVFLSFIFFNSGLKERDIREPAVKFLSYLVLNLYDKYVVFYSFQSIQSKTPDGMKADLPGSVSVIDGTYLYGESSYFAGLHQEMYCHYKNEQQLSKFIIMCSPCGKVQGCYGPFSGCISDDKIFSEKILKVAKQISLGEGRQELSEFNKHQAKKLWHWLSSLPEEASLVFDAGFPKSADFVPHLKVFLPIKMRKGEESYEPAAAVKARGVTRWRGVIERVNRGIKVFHLLSVRFPNSSLPNAELYFQSACILFNRYKGDLAKLE